MASYADLQEALVRYTNAQEKYWLTLEEKAKEIKEGLTDYLGKTGNATEANGEAMPYVSLGVMKDGDFLETKASKLPAYEEALDFTLRVIIEGPDNPHYKVAHMVDLEMRMNDGKLEVLIDEGHQKHPYSFPDVFNERHQTQLFDAITNTIIKRLDTSHFS